MKKIFLVGFVTLFAGFLMAQSPASGRADSMKNNKGFAAMRNGSRMQVNKEAMAKERAKKLSEKYKLNEEQTRKVEELCKKNIMKLQMRQQSLRPDFANGGKQCCHQAKCGMKHNFHKKNDGKNRELRINALVALVKEYAPTSKFDETAVRQRIMGIMSMREAKPCDSSACKMKKAMQCPMQKQMKHGNMPHNFAPAAGKGNMQQMKDVRQEFENGLQEIMTKKQFEAYKKDRQDRKDKAQKDAKKGKQDKKRGEKKS